MARNIVTLGMLGIFLLSSKAHAFDLSQYKDKIRSHMAQMLGEEVTSKVMGKEEKSTVQLPEIPQVKSDATSTEVYENKNRKIEKQGDAFNKLSLEAKRKYRIAYIQEIYQVTRNSEPKENDILKFLNVLEQGGSREGVYRAVTLDSVYSSLESYEEVPEKGLQEFVVAYGEKYLARRFDQEAIGKLNLWSIKRIIVEKTLEMMDVMGGKPDDLMAWYAVLSAELANKYPQVWKNKVRQSKSDEYHLQWARKAPFQHIKSETIIKLHEVMNFLNQSQQ